ncbi:MAG: competence/damage-inducible protein A [Acidobacteria bacterium]|nr:competence/damage-inducible protein A [Acidobacteriota bacterium]
MDAEIIAVGSELLTPFRQDTNSLYLTDKLNALGIEVRYKTIVGDDRARIAVVVRTALERSRWIIVTGGLGPTEDDLSREVVAEVLGRPLHEDSRIRRRIELRFARVGRAMPPNNLRQAQVPEGAECLENKMGTAPGLWIEQGGAVVILLPGPPRELESVFESQCLTRLELIVPRTILRTRIYKVIGLAESEVDHRIAPLYNSYNNPVTTILATPNGIEIHLRARAADDSAAEALLAELGDKIESEMGESIFSTGGETIEEVVGRHLALRHKTLAVAESCTGGLLSEQLTRVAGSSNYFLGGTVCYSNELKTQLAGVPGGLMAEHGAVSKPVAQALAAGIRRRTGASIGVGITGIAGPAGGSENKPVGLVFIALADELGVQVREFRFPGDRDRVRLHAAMAALEMIRRRLRD